MIINNVLDDMKIIIRCTIGRESTRREENTEILLATKRKRHVP